MTNQGHPGAEQRASNTAARGRVVRLGTLVLGGAAAVSLALWIIVSSLEGPISSSASSTPTPTAALPTAPTTTTILDQPQDTRIATSGKKRLSVDVYTPTTAKYQWYRLYGNDWKPISNATSSTLTVAGTARNNGARYRVKVTSTDKTLTSEVAQTTVVAPTQTPKKDFATAFGTGVVTSQGVDLSRWNRPGDLDAMAHAGWEFTLIKTGGSDRGHRYVDPTYKQRIDVARSNELHVGHYWFNGGSDPKAAARYFVKHLTSVRDGDPIVLDVEPWKNAKGHTKNPWTPDQVKTFLTEVKAKRPSANLYVYMTEQQTWKADWTQVASIARLWVASWGDNVGVLPSSQPFVSGWNTWQIWQYSSYGRPAGFDGHRVDVNIAKADSWTTK